MNQWLIRLCLRFACWLGWTPPAPVAATPLLAEEVADAARTAVLAADALQAGGEYKRHQVYAHLVKRFPHLPHWELAFAIEWVIRERRTAA